MSCSCIEGEKQSQGRGCAGRSGSSHIVVAPSPRDRGQLDWRSWRGGPFCSRTVLSLVEGASHAFESQRCTRHAADTFERRGSTESCGGGSYFPRTTRAGWSKFGSQHSTSCKGRGPNSKCDRFLPPSSHSSPNIHWSWISAFSQNVFRMRRQGGPQDREGAGTRCGGCVWTIMRSSSCSSGPLKISLEPRVAFMSMGAGTSFRRLVAKTLPANSANRLRQLVRQRTSSDMQSELSLTRTDSHSAVQMALGRMTTS